ncbi:hypothetical protein Tco_0290792 [Tanacetum coccineum]
MTGTCRHLLKCDLFPDGVAVSLSSTSGVHHGRFNYFSSQSFSFFPNTRKWELMLSNWSRNRTITGATLSSELIYETEFEQQDDGRLRCFLLPGKFQNRSKAVTSITNLKACQSTLPFGIAGF